MANIIDKISQCIIKMDTFLEAFKVWKHSDAG